MSRSYWIIGTSALIAFSAFCILIYYAGYGSAKIENRTEHHTKEYANSSYSRMQDACTDRNGINLFECVSDVIVATNEHMRSEDDLEAQRYMAKWAFWMLIAAVVIGITTAAVTAAGVWYVAKTLDATRRALDVTQDMANDTREIGEAQVRAYLDITDFVVTFHPEARAYIARATIRNSGNSPSVNTPSVSQHLVINAHIQVGGDAHAIKIGPLEILISGISAGGNILTTDILLCNTEISECGVIANVDCDIIWGDVFKKDHHARNRFTLFSGNDGSENVLRAIGSQQYDKV